MKKYFILAFVIVLLGGASLVYFYPQDEVETITALEEKTVIKELDKVVPLASNVKVVEPVVVKTTPTVVSNTYSSAKYGFSINPPANWVSTTSVEVNNGSETATIHFHDKNDLKDIPDSAITFYITKIKDIRSAFESYYGRAVTDEEVVNSLLDYESETNNEWVLEGVSKIKINDVVAYEAKANYLAKIDSRPVTVREYYFFPGGEYVYIVFSYSYTDLWNKYGDSIVKAIKTFNYIK